MLRSKTLALTYAVCLSVLTLYSLSNELVAVFNLTKNNNFDSVAEQSSFIVLNLVMIIDKWVTVIFILGC